MALKTFFAKKHGMTQHFDADGMAVPVTVLEVLPMMVTALKTKEKHGYSAVQVGYEPCAPRKLTRAQVGHLKAAFGDAEPQLLRRLKEIRVCADTVAEYAPGTAVALDAVLAAKSVDVRGITIGKGFQGAIRRWGHHRGPMSHGSKNHRLPGSIGAGTTPGRVYKGLHMAGNTGAVLRIQRNLKVMHVLADERLLLVKGSVPGVENSVLQVDIRHD